MIRKAPRSIGAVVGAVLTLAFAVTAQRPLTHDDYDQWQSLRGNACSADGKWVAFQIEPQWGDGVLEVRQTEGTVVHRHPLASGARFSSDNRYVVFSIGKSKVEARNKQLDELRKKAAEPEKTEEEAGAARGAGPGAGFGAGAAGARGGRGGAGAGGPPAGAGGGRGGRGGPGGPGGGDESASVRGDMGVMDLATGKVEVIKHVKGFTLPDEAALLIYHLDSAEAIAEAEKAEAEKKEAEKKEAEKKEGGAAKEPAAKPEEPKVEEPKAEEPKASEPATQEQGARGGRQGRGGRGGQAGTQGPGGRGRTPGDPMERKRKEGSTMVVRTLADGTERRVDHVVSYGLTRKAKWFYYHTSVKKPDAQKSYGLFAEKLDGSGKVTLLNGVADVSGITSDREETSLAFLSNLADFSADKPKSDIYLWDGSEKAARAIVTGKTKGVPAGYLLGSPSFSRDGSVLEFTVQPPAEPDPPAYLPDEKVALDLWHWNDPQIQTAQAKGAGRRGTSRSVVFHRNAEKLLVVGDDQIERVRMITPDGSRAIATDGTAYEKLTTWDGRYTDVYLVNTFNGTRTKVLEKLRGNAANSPGGRYLLWFTGGNWNSYDVATGERRNLTAGLPVSFGREDDDHPEADSNYGVCGWTKDDQAVVVYDEFDLWQITPRTGEAVCVTDGFGRATRTQLRHLSIEREQEGLPAELLLTSVNQDTLVRGVYKDWLDSVKKPFRVFQIEKGLDGITKAKKADRFFFTVQTFAEPPDLWTSDAEFKSLKKLSSLNPQQKDYRWGKAELVHWIDGDGKPARGILVKPDGFDPKQKYPMLVYFYEKMSNNLNRYVSPAPGTSPNASYYVSNGYLFFMPDITYEVGYPGSSCVKCVVSGVQSLVAQGFVDPRGIGAAGHSWGGYQTAFLVTRTNIFKAVESGAPVCNMISAYGGIRYGSGVSRQFQYERTQSRIGGTPWEYPLRFWENSPIYFADKVNTPVLILHNDQDGAVPWTQGIEYFMALRRLGKEAYLFNYTGEDHGLGKRQNQKDWSRRMSEYFGHHLRGEAAPKWMKDGVPFNDRDKEKLAWAPSYQDITRYVDKVKSEAKAVPAVAPVGEPAAAEATAEPAQRGGGDPSAVPAGGKKPAGGGEDNGDTARAPVETPAGLQTGAPAPDFAVADHTGKVRTLKEFAGKKVLIWFFPRANTPGCTAEGCAFRDRFKEFEQEGVVVLGASVDPVADNLAFHQKNDFPFPLLSDVDRKLGVAYGACSDAKAPAARRNAVLIDGKGRIVRTWERVDAGTFPGEVLNELRALAK